MTAKPVFMENIAARLRRDGSRAYPIRVIAFDLENPVFLDSRGEVGPQLARLHEPNTAIMDRLSMKTYGFNLTHDATFPQKGELCQNPLNIIGTFQCGRDFAHDGNMIMSQENFATYFPFRSSDPLSIVDIGMVKLDSKVNATSACESLQKHLGEKVTVLTKQQFIGKEVRFWSKSTPVGVIFFIGTIMGFVVGVIICYQILANDISEHMSEFATLKAMGYKNQYFFGVIICQAMYLAVLGFIPGLILSWVLFLYNSNSTGLLMYLTLPRVSLILVATLAMCIISGLLAVRKLLAADPASLF
jgi:putative ABC transport system permease protein